ncbi:MAG: asparaginase [Alphaproteobacteria bacterium]|nr:asparaginase [Alphaproteobacteria bacterium]
MSENPVLIEATRGDMVESRHRGLAVVADPRGTVVAAWGDAGRLIYPRSAIKPLQALAVIESGAAKHFGMSGEEIALCCASHAGQPAHTERVAAWLARMGFSGADLRCGAHAPVNAATAEDLIRAGARPCALHNNCSGKHAGMLATARHMGEPTGDYIAPDHPVQVRLRNLLAEMGNEALEAAPRGVDGCGIPVYGMTLKSLATAMARLASPDDLPAERADAAWRVIAAMSAHPDLVSGKGRFDTEIMTIAGGRAIVKGGAEGVHAAALPASGLGIAVKIEDGAGRASAPLMAGLLARFADLSHSAETALAPWREQPITNAAGKTVGVIRLAETF